MDSENQTNLRVFYATEAGINIYDVPTGSRQASRNSTMQNSPSNNNNGPGEATTVHYDRITGKNNRNNGKIHSNRNVYTHLFITIASFLLFSIVSAALFAVLFTQYTKLQLQLNQINSILQNQENAENKSQNQFINNSYDSQLYELFMPEEFDIIKEWIKNISITTYTKLYNEIFEDIRDDGLPEIIPQILYYIFAKMGHDSLYPAPSCCFILHHNPSFQSEFYWIGSIGSGLIAFCNMSHCEDYTTGWTTIAKLDMSIENESCLTNFTKAYCNKTSYCELNKTNSSCSSFYFPVNTTYINVSGTMRGFGCGSLDGFVQEREDINEAYLDGISLTYEDQGKRKHIWSIVTRAFCNEFVPCPRRNPPSFVNTSFSVDSLQSDAFLWDENYCGATTSPVFFRNLPEPTTSDIEIRLCLDDSGTDERLGISYIQLYVQ